MAFAGQQQRALRLAVGVAQAHAHQETVELRFRQPEGAELLMRILRRHYEKWLRERMRHAVDADLPLFHRLEQGALRLGAGAVDLVGQQQLREHRSGPELELLGDPIEHRDADDVGRQQVAGELEPPPIKPQHPCECVRERGFAYPGHVLEQQVSARQQAGETQPDLHGFAENHFLDGGHGSAQTAHDCSART